MLSNVDDEENDGEEKRDDCGALIQRESESVLQRLIACENREEGRRGRKFGMKNEDDDTACFAELTQFIWAQLLVH